MALIKSDHSRFPRRPFEIYSMSIIPEGLPALHHLSIVIPARDEEGCIASTIEHLHLELQLQGVPHEIIVVDDGSCDRTWEILKSVQTKNFRTTPCEEPRPAWIRSGNHPRLGCHEGGCSGHYDG